MEVRRIAPRHACRVCRQWRRTETNPPSMYAVLCLRASCRCEGGSAPTPDSWRQRVRHPRRALAGETEPANQIAIARTATAARAPRATPRSYTPTILIRVSAPHHGSPAASQPRRADGITRGYRVKASFCALGSGSGSAVRPSGRAASTRRPVYMPTVCRPPARLACGAVRVPGAAARYLTCRSDSGLGRSSRWRR